VERDQRLAQQLEARQAWLTSAVRKWTDDPNVVGAWLWGSEGAGTADALSDFDLFVVLSDTSPIDDVDARFESFGDVLWAREVAYNAPEAGRYFTVGYPGPLQPIAIDWYWQPASHAMIGTDTRVLVEKSLLPRAAAPTFSLFPNVRDEVPYQHPEDARERLEGQLVWFWFMFGPLSKWAARGQHALPTLDAVLGMAELHVAADHQQLPPADPLASWRTVAERMTAIGSRLSASGVAVPEDERARGLEALALAESLGIDT
jgi:hypothetical protein